MSWRELYRIITSTLPDAVFTVRQFSITVSEQDTLSVLSLALLKMSEGRTSWSGVAELLALVVVGDALVDHDDVTLGLLANSSSEHSAGYHRRSS